VYSLNDLLGRPFSLHYLRTKDGAEVDFCIAENNVPKLMIEVKRLNEIWNDCIKKIGDLIKSPMNRFSNQA
jgi:hypothetical protein